jgi:hypothetical protein
MVIGRRTDKEAVRTSGAGLARTNKRQRMALLTLQPEKTVAFERWEKWERCSARVP